MRRRDRAADGRARAAAKRAAGIAVALDDGIHAAAAVTERYAGDHGALIRRGEAAERRSARHLQERALYCKLDARWPASNFWRSRGDLGA